MSIFDSIFNEESFKETDVCIDCDDNIALMDRLTSLESAMAESVSQYDSMLADINEIDNARNEIADKAAIGDYESAEASTIKAIELSRAFLSKLSDESADMFRSKYIDRIDVKDRFMLSTYSAEAFNFIESAIALGKKALQKMVEFILYIYRLIKGIVVRILGKVGLKAKVQSTNKKPEDAPLLSTQEELDNAAAKIKEKPLKAGDANEAEIRELMKKSNFTGTVVKIPASNAKALYNHTSKKMYESFEEVCSDIELSRREMLRLTTETFNKLSDVASNEYYSFMTFIFSGKDDGRASDMIRRASVPPREDRSRAIEDAINTKFYECIDVPKECDGKVYYPGIRIKKPDPKKPVDIYNMVTYEDKVSAGTYGKLCSESKFKVPTVSAFNTALDMLADFTELLSDISDSCEKRVKEVESALSKISALSSTPAGSVSYLTFIQHKAKTNTSRIAFEYNSSILNILTKISKAQLSSCIAMNALFEGTKEKSKSKGILKIICDELNLDLQKKGQEIILEAK